MATESEKRKAVEDAGYNWDELTEDQRESLYRDYAGERDVANAEYTSAEERYNEEGPKGRNSGRVYSAANPLEHLASALRRRGGKKDRETAKGTLGELSKASAKGRRVAGGLAAGRENRIMGLYEKMIESRNKKNQVTAPQLNQANPNDFRASRPPMASAQSPVPQPQMATGGAVPGNPAQWNEYAMQAKVGADPRIARLLGKPEEEEEVPGGYFGFGM